MLQRRLMNVSQAVVTGLGPTDMDVRCDCVEITCRPGGPTLVVLMRLHKAEDRAIVDPEGPRLVARVSSPLPAVVFDAAETDWVAWIIAFSDGSTIVVRPFAGESIWLDRSFGRADVEADRTLKALYAELRTTRASRQVAERVVAGIPDGQPQVAKVHRGVVDQLDRLIVSLERQIRAKEKQHDPKK